MKLDNDVVCILETLNNSGFESFVVGGCVRDALMNKKPKDFDITTSATPIEIKNLFSKTIDTGIEHGTVTVVINKTNYEITTFRVDGDYIDNRKPQQVLFTTNITEDLKRRDFNINAIAYNKSIGFIDPFNGKDDIKNKIITGVGNPSVRFTEDALRMFRAIRFSTQLGFFIEENTFNGILEKNYLVTSLSVERVRDELTKTLLGEYTANLSYLLTTNLFKFYYNDLQVYLNTNLPLCVEALHICKADYILKYVILLENYPADKTEKFLNDFKFDNKTKKNIMSLKKALSLPIENTELFSRILIQKYGFHIVENLLYLLKNIKKVNISKLNIGFKNAIRYEHPVFISMLAVNGNDLKKINISKGLHIGITLHYLLNEVVKDPSLNNKHTLLNLALNYINTISTV